MLAKVRWYEYTHESTCRCHWSLTEAARVPNDVWTLLYVNPVSVFTVATTLPVDALEVPVNAMEVPVDSRKEALKVQIETVEC